LRCLIAAEQMCVAAVQRDPHLRAIKPTLRRWDPKHGTLRVVDDSRGDAAGQASERCVTPGAEDDHRDIAFLGDAKDVVAALPRAVIGWAFS
jgi:hypothetical protein